MLDRIARLGRDALATDAGISDRPNPGKTSNSRVDDRWSLVPEVEGGETGQASAHLGLVVEVEVPVGVKLRIPDGECTRRELLARRLEVGTPGDAEDVAAFQVFAC